VLANSPFPDLDTQVAGEVGLGHAVLLGESARPLARRSVRGNRIHILASISETEKKQILNKNVYEF
jgi:hypothetical protein